MIEKLFNAVHRDPWGAALYVLRVVFLVSCLIAVLLLVGCATVKSDGLQADGSMTYTLTPEQVAQCLAEGGCSTVTLQYEHQLIRDAAKHFCGVEI